MAPRGGPKKKIHGTINAFRDALRFPLILAVVGGRKIQKPKIDGATPKSQKCPHYRWYRKGKEKEKEKERKRERKRKGKGKERKGKEKEKERKRKGKGKGKGKGKEKERKGKEKEKERKKDEKKKQNRWRNPKIAKVSTL